MQNLRSFNIKYISPTDTKGTRIRIYDNRFCKTIFINQDYELNSSTEVANKYLESIGIKCLYVTETKQSYTMLTDNFEVQLTK